MSPQQSQRTARTKEAISVAARTILQTKPTKNLSMVSLASTSGIARATVYNHIAEKSDIYQLIYESYLEDVSNLIAKSTSLTEGLKNLAEFVVNDPAIKGLHEHDPKALISAISFIHKMPDEIAKISMDALLKWNATADLISADVAIRWITSFAFDPGTEVDRQVGAELLALALGRNI